MGIDFDGLLLNVGQEVFGISVSVYPVKSMPGQPAYAARGVFSSSPLNVEMQDGTVFSDQQTTLSIRASEFDTVPMRGDRVKIDSTGNVYWVSDSSVDGQGAVSLQLRNTEPAGDTT